MIFILAENYEKYRGYVDDLRRSKYLHVDRMRDCLFATDETKVLTNLTGDDQFLLMDGAYKHPYYRDIMKIFIDRRLVRISEDEISSVINHKSFITKQKPCLLPRRLRNNGMLYGMSKNGKPFYTVDSKCY